MPSTVYHVKRPGRVPRQCELKQPVRGQVPTPPSSQRVSVGVTEQDVVLLLPLGSGDSLSIPEHERLYQVITFPLRSLVAAPLCYTLVRLLIRPSSLRWSLHLRSVNHLKHRGSLSLCSPSCSPTATRDTPPAARLTDRKSTRLNSSH